MELGCIQVRTEPELLVHIRIDDPALVLYLGGGSDLEGRVVLPKRPVENIGKILVK